MYKGKFASWKIGKNGIRKDYLELARLITEHRSGGFAEGSFEVHNKIRSIEDLKRYLKQRGETESEFFAEAMAAPTSTPPYIRCLVADHGKWSCANKLGHLLKAVNLEESRTAQASAASQSSSKAADDQHFNPYLSLDPPSSAELRDNGVANTLNAIAASSAMGQDSSPLSSLNVHQQWNVPQVGTLLGRERLAAAHQNFTDGSYPQVQTDNSPGAAAFSELSNLSTWQVLVNVGNDPTRFDASGYAEESLPFVDPWQDVSAIITQSSASSAPPTLSLEGLHFPGGLRRRNNRSLFMSACMLVCMYAAAKRVSEQALCLEQALSAFRNLCAASSPFTLTSAITMLTWMFVHVEGSLTEDVIWSMHRVASEVLGKNDPICVLLHWMFVVARTKLNESLIDSSELRRVWHVFRESHGEHHRHSIVARYCLAFHLIRVDRLFNAEALPEAVDHLGQLETIATNALGASDLMTINIVSTLSRAHSRMGNYPLALETINRSLQAEPLGANHPHRLEGIVRKAVICLKLDQWDEAERLYWIAARGRIATLGRDHRSSIKAHNSLVKVLKDRGRWDSMRDRAHRLLADPQVAVTEYESWWRRVVESNRGVGGPRASSEESE
jgi:hypothetical protein